MSAEVRRRQVHHAVERGLSQRRACCLCGVARSSLCYVSRLNKRDAKVIAAMRELSRLYPRYGYRCIQVFLARQGFKMSAQRTYRLWREAGLQLPRRRSRKRVASGRPRPLAPQRAHQVWAYDFVYDRCANGQQLKCLTVIDEWTRQCLAIEVAGSIRSRHVIDVLSKLASEQGAPTYLRSDNGPEFVARAVIRWLHGSGIETAAIEPGKPWKTVRMRASTTSSQTSA